ncbi:MAG TPA: tRNA pseudouridine(55) synthase TruB [Bellilinea sp.]|nr:tRNA pseudouridine(55) synthase TruB [Bellilinea sp.]
MARRSRAKKEHPPVVSMLEQFGPLLTPDQWDQLTAELESPLRGAIRLNTLKVPNSKVHDWAELYGWSIDPVPYCPTGWWIDQAETSPARTLEHRMGQYYMQDAASMLPPQLFDFSGTPAPLILDMAASPGGKTTHIGSLTGDRGLIIANDFGADRLTALRLVLQNWGLVSAAVTRFPGEKFGRWFPETFDAVLLDAPCSMQSLRSTDSHPMRPISAREQSSLARRQFKLLESALSAVKVDGQIVYSTCTLSPEEDELVLQALLEEYGDSVELVLPLRFTPNPAPALSVVNGIQLNTQIANALRLWPHSFGTSGFFAAKIIKTASIPTQQEEPPSRTLQSVGQYAMADKEVADLHDFFSSNYNFDLTGNLEEQELDLRRTENAVFAVPQRYLSQFSTLPCQMLGLRVASYTPDGFEPSHDWMSRYFNWMSGGRVSLDEEQSGDWQRGNDVSISAKLDSPGYPILIDREQRFLGLGKRTPAGIKNLLPRRLI